MIIYSCTFQLDNSSALPLRALASAFSQSGTIDQEPNRSGDIRTVDEEPNQFGELREAVPTPVMERPTLIPPHVATWGKTFFD